MTLLNFKAFAALDVRIERVKLNPLNPLKGDVSDSAGGQFDTTWEMNEGAP